MKSKLFTIALLLLILLLITGCSSKHETLSVVSPHVESTTPNNVPSGCAEPASYVYKTVDELSACICYNTFGTGAIITEGSVCNDSIAHFYAPTADSFPGYVLFQIEEILDRSIIYYYMPASGKLTHFDNSSGITVTYYTEKLMTLDSHSRQYEIEIDDNGYIYNEIRRTLAFMAGSNLVVIDVPESLNNYDTIKSLCTMEKITVEYTELPPEPEPTEEPSILPEAR